MQNISCCFNRWGIIIRRNWLSPVISVHTKHLCVDFRPHKGHLIVALLFLTHIHAVKMAQIMQLLLCWWNMHIHAHSFLVQSAQFWLLWNVDSFCHDHLALSYFTEVLNDRCGIMTKALLACVQHFLWRCALMSGQMSVVAVEATVAAAVKSVCWTTKARNVMHCEAINKEAHPFQTRLSRRLFIYYGADVLKRICFLFKLRLVFQ